MKRIGLGFGLLSNSTQEYFPVANTIYIDQTNVAGGRNGSHANPYNSFSETTLQDSYEYKLKGTYTTSTPIDLTSRTGIKITSYGFPLAKFNYTGASAYAIRINNSTNCVIRLDVDCNGTTLRGIYLGDGSNNLGGSGHTISGKVHNCYQGASDYASGIQGGGTNITIDNCEIYDTGSDGMYLVNTTNLKVNWCYIHHINQNYGNVNNLGNGASGDGIQLDGSWNGYHISNTIIDRSDANTGNKFCIIANSANGTNDASSGIIERCTFKTKTGVTVAVYLAQGNGTIVRYNTFEGTTGGIGIYNYSFPANTYFNTCKNTLIHSNIFYNCSYGVGVAYGGATDNRNTKAYNNVFYNIPMHIWVDRTFIDSRNNIHLRANGTDVAIHNYGSGTWNIENNCYGTTATIGNPGSGKDSITANPLFVDAVNHNFHLQPGSPCINTGTDVGLTIDFDGNTVATLNMGAYFN